MEFLDILTNVAILLFSFVTILTIYYVNARLKEISREMEKMRALQESCFDVFCETSDRLIVLQQAKNESPEGTKNDN